MSRPRVAVSELASMLGRFSPSAVAMLNADRGSISEQLAEHMIAELALTEEAAEHFYAIVTSPVYAERTPA